MQRPVLLSHYGGVKTVIRRAPKLKPWQHALTSPLPPSVSYELLDRLRKNVPAYLDWVTHDMIQGDRKGALREIQRVADRLTRITAMTRGALERAVQE